MSRYFTTALAALILLSGAVSAISEEANTADSPAIDLADFDAAPDGVSILALDGSEFKILSIATAHYKSSAPAALSSARTVAITKAKGAISRFLNESVSAEDFVEKEVTKVRTVSPDGTVSVAQASARRVLSRIQTQSNSLLRGVVVLQTEKIPDEEGPGGSMRVLAGVSSTTLQGASALEAGIGSSAP